MRIVTVSDSPLLYSGLARVHRHVIDGLVAAGHEVIPCAWFGYDSATLKRMQEEKGFQPPPIIYKSGGKDVRMLCVPKKGGHNCMFAIYEVMAEVKADVLLTIGDYWDFYYVSALKSKLDFGFKWLAYLTVEQEIGSQWKSLLGYADALACPSLFGCKMLKDACGKDAAFVPYGTESVFCRYPKERREALRKERSCEGKVRFISVGQNTDRKNLPALMLAVKRIADESYGKELLSACRFYLHSNFQACDQEANLYDLDEIADRLGVHEYFDFSAGVSLFDAPDDGLLADEYNASDFLISASYSEGYGLPMVEAMACGLPAIANATSTAFEHLGVWHDLRGGTFDYLQWPIARRGPAPRGYLVENDLKVFPRARLGHEVNAASLSRAIVWASSKFPQARLEEMSLDCQKYGRRSWEEMGRSICGLASKACESASASVPLESF
jgi:glycosyltransferase involved in cell wall biosynthesis